jgi:GDP-L-fucose synthase
VTDTYTLKGKRVWVAGHRGMVGAALVRRLAQEECHLLTLLRDEADLRDQHAVRHWMEANRPEAVFVAAAKVGGISANDHFPAEFLYDNLMIEANIIESAHRVGVQKLMFLGSSCIYPKLAPQPMPEEALLTGPLEPTNEWYAIAKIAGIKLCQSYRRQYGANFVSAMPTNLYGPGDNFHLENSHVVPALMRKAHLAKLEGAKSIAIWGTGKPRREFLHVDDCAGAVVHLMKYYDDETHVNVGFGEDIEIRELARLICRVVGFEGELAFDTRRADGAPRKLMSSARLRGMGWKPSIPLEEGLAATYRWYQEQEGGVRREGS